MVSLVRRRRRRPCLPATALPIAGRCGPCRKPARSPSLAAIVGLPLALGLAACAADLSPAPPPSLAPGAPGTRPAEPTAAVRISAATPAILPTPSPPSALPAAGFLFADSFDEAGAWSLGETRFGASSITQGGLVLAARQPSAAVLALAPTEPPTDFEAEILVRPEVCADDDEFGFVLRANPLGEHYRVALTCGGTARLVRVLSDQTRSLTPPSATSAIIPGAGSSNRLKVIARGPDLQVLVNDQEVLVGRDTVLAAGRIGTFAKAGRGGQVTVRFDDLRVLPAASPSPSP